MLVNESLYHDQTVFDQLVSWSKQRWARALPADREQCWGGFFLAFSLLQSGIAIFFLFSALSLDNKANISAHVIGTALMAIVVGYFLRIGQQLLAPARVEAPVKLPPAKVEAGNETSASNQPAQAHPRQFFRIVRDAGVNVKIARALYTGGIRCAEDLNGKTDADLLAIRGVGPATVRKLRGHFNFVEEYYEV